MPRAASTPEAFMLMLFGLVLQVIESPLHGAPGERSVLSGVLRLQEG